MLQRFPRASISIILRRPTLASPQRISYFSVRWTGGPTSTASAGSSADILPLIRRAAPECSLTVVGRRSPRRKSCGWPKPTPASTSPARCRTCARTCGNRLCPSFRYASAEARASKSTKPWPPGSRWFPPPSGAEGLDVRDGENIALADSPGHSPSAAWLCSATAEARRKQAQAAWEMVSACYSWEVVARKFEALLL